LISVLNLFRLCPLKSTFRSYLCPSRELHHCIHFTAIQLFSHIIHQLRLQPFTTKSFIGTAQCLPLPTPYVKMRKPRHFIYSRNFQKSYSSKFGSPMSRAAFAICEVLCSFLGPRKNSEESYQGIQGRAPSAKYTSCTHRGKASCHEVLLHCL
jgi:hypothetical protein